MGLEPTLSSLEGYRAAITLHTRIGAATGTRTPIDRLAVCRPAIGRWPQMALSVGLEPTRFQFITLAALTTELGEPNLVDPS